MTLFVLIKDRWQNFNDKALKPALKEVSFLTEFEITAEPIRTGRAVTHIKFSWHKKTDVGAQIAAVEELERSKTGRKTRMQGEIEDLFTITSSQKSDSSPAASAHISSFLPKLEENRSRLLVSASGIDGAREVIRKSGQRLDVYALEKEFLEHAGKTGFKPDRVDGAFVGFVKKKIDGF